MDKSWQITQGGNMLIELDHNIGKIRVPVENGGGIVPSGLPARNSACMLSEIPKWRLSANYAIWWICLWIPTIPGLLRICFLIWSSDAVSYWENLLNPSYRVSSSPRAVF